MPIKFREAEIFTTIHPTGEMFTCIRKVEALYDENDNWVRDLGGLEVVDATSEEVSKAIGTRGIMAAQMSTIKTEYAKAVKENEELRGQVKKLTAQVEKMTAKGVKK